MVEDSLEGSADTACLVSIHAYIIHVYPFMHMTKSVMEAIG